MPRFCPACGAAIGVPAPVTCSRCGAEHWAKPSLAAAALVVDEGRLLLVRRAIEPWRGSWCAPSGFCDGAEHPVAAAEREALEEARLRVRVVGYLGHWIDEYLPGTSDGMETQHCAVSYYHAVPLDARQAARAGDEVDEVGWFAPDELPAELAPPGNGAAIYAAWRRALAEGRLETPLLDRP